MGKYRVKILKSQYTGISYNYPGNCIIIYKQYTDVFKNIYWERVASSLDGGTSNIENLSLFDFIMAIKAKEVEFIDAKEESK